MIVSCTNGKASKTYNNLLQHNDPNHFLEIPSLGVELAINIINILMK